jgi:hypothetical protein
MNMSILDKFVDYDKTQVNSIHSRLEKACIKLQKLEKDYKINNLSDSLRLKFPNTEAKGRALRQWGEIKKLSEELDYLFLEE